MRIYLIDTVRKHASKIFALNPPIDVQVYAKDYDRSTIPALVELLKSPKKPDELHATYPRILFKDYTVDNAKLFGSVAILNVSPFHLVDVHHPSHPCDFRQILKAILHGPTSVGSTSAQRSGPKGYAHAWELKAITPGCIAMAAVVVSDLPPL
jgi:hypothetical protein